MSARMPFVPGGAPRPTTASPSTPQFVADPSNPLNGGPIAPESTDNRPLNIGSLTKSNRSQTPASRRPSLQSAAAAHIPRPSTSDPHTKPKSSTVPNHRLHSHLSSSHGIIAPTPVQGRATPSLFSNSASFKTPALPSSRASPHQLPVANDQINGDQSHDENVSPNPLFRVKILPEQPGPHRIVFGARPVTDLTQDEDDEEIYENHEPEEEGAQSRNRTKRRRSDMDKEAEEERYAKRFKSHEEVVDRRVVNENIYSDGNDMYGRHSSPHQGVDHQHQHQQQQLPRHAHHTGRVPLPPQFASGYPHSQHNASGMPMPQHANPQHTADLERLLQLFKMENVDLRIEGRIEKYERSSEKWKTCTREEWLAGADELSANFGKIFDDIKAHMSKKFEVFASCEGRIKQQHQTLKERDGVLESVRGRLVAEGGHVLGS
ncbi:hypothetical protein FB45DRAFT_1061030 [Roridomyces roridus]|uniref:Extracellular mutant protein 11 C-terminal domain-containing protein n=1 Tax=Roridomyces roridus TaxID=1738132 RepID=A0AAD7FHW0_9AGAR|nr:hypothetical protein FB45DRAFT_1061030 [Roridomyces roridus]